MSQNLIKDGYTRDGYVKAFPGVYDEFRFTYRPMLPNDVTRCEHALQNCREGVEGAVMANWAARYIETWEEVDESGVAFPVSFANVQRLPYLILLTALNIIKGVRESDDDPKDELKSEEQMTELESAMRGTPPGLDTLEREVKN